MKKILVNIIIFFLLGSNVAWAFDVGEQIQEREAQSHFFVSSHNTGSHETTNVTCDHCCHGNAHFLGIFSGQAEVSHYFTGDPVSFIAKTLPITNHQPPTPPPNV